MARKHFDVEKEQQRARLITTAALRIQRAARRATRRQREDGTLALKTTRILNETGEKYGKRAWEKNGGELAVLTLAARAA